MITLRNYIDGAFCPPAGGTYLDNLEPATGEVYSLIPDSGADDVAAAVAAAKKAYPGWSALTASERSKHLMRVANRIEERLEELAAAESRDNGKPLKLARTVDIPRARDNFAFYATAILHDWSETHDMGAHGFNYTLRRPIGVAACISPWNLPLYLFSWKIAPALAAGNTVVAKPSEVTPYTAYLLSEILDEVGFPAGVLNIVHGTGPGVGEPLVTHPDVPMISFTGGTATGAIDLPAKCVGLLRQRDDGIDISTHQHGVQCPLRLGIFLHALPISHQITVYEGVTPGHGDVAERLE
jgi:aminomuconate-semialdehyde/2-hydroxymuconate-6-semialdehyde dehydrogenase